MMGYNCEDEESEDNTQICSDDNIIVLKEFPEEERNEYYTPLT